MKQIVDYHQINAGWIRYDDYCGANEVWRREYLQQGNKRITEDKPGLIQHNLEDQVVLCVMEKTELYPEQDIGGDTEAEARDQIPDPVPLSQGLSSDSDQSSDDVSGPCIRCVEEPNLISMRHLQENPVCLAACMREQLPRSWWTTLPAGEVDVSELLFDIGIRLKLCLNTESCPLPNGDLRRVAFARHLTDSAGCFQFFRSTSFVIQKEWHNLSAFDLGRRRQRRKEMMVRDLEEISEQGPVGYNKMMRRQMTEACSFCSVQGPLLRDFMLEERRYGYHRKSAN